MGKENLEYRPDIDGLRGIAVAAVVLFHCHLGLSGGYVGVDVFFVISGFLITRLILKAQETDSFSLRNFWIRRIRRLAPAATAVVLFTMAVSAWIMLPHDFYYFTKSSLAQVLLASNFHFVRLDYFAGATELQPLLHTWSLAIEEQFYLVFPFLLVFTKNWPRRRLGWLLAALAAISFTYSLGKIHSDPQEAFYLLPSRAWELLLGALLVLAPSISAPSTRAPSAFWAATWETVSALSFLGVLTSFVMFNSATAFPGIAALLPCIATAVLIYANSQQTTFVSRILSVKWLVGLGLISYSVYLWHWPILSLLHYVGGEMLTQTVTISALVVSIVSGLLSWRFIETPFRRRTILKTDASLIRMAVACSLLISTVSIASLLTRGLPSRWGDEVTQAVALSRGCMPQYKTGKVRLARADKLPRIGAQGKKPTILIWGDSHAAALGQLCDRLAQENNIAGYVASRYATTPLLGTWRAKANKKSIEWNDAVLELVRRNEIQHVILISRWAVNISNDKDGIKLISDEQSTERSQAESTRVLQRGLVLTVSALQELNVNVWIVKQVPFQVDDPFKRLIHSMTNLQKSDAPTHGITLAEHRDRQRAVERVFAKLKGVNFVDPTASCFNNNGLSLVGTNEFSYYRDATHLSAKGSHVLVGPALRPAFAEIASGRSRIDVADGSAKREPAQINR